MSFVKGEFHSENICESMRGRRGLITPFFGGAGGVWRKLPYESLNLKNDGWGCSQDKIAEALKK